MCCHVWRRCTATYGGDVLSRVEVMSGHCVSSLLVSSVCVKSSVFWSVLCVSGQFYVCPVCWSVLCVQSVGQLYVCYVCWSFLCVHVCWSVLCPCMLISPVCPVCWSILCCVHICWLRRLADCESTFSNRPMLRPRVQVSTDPTLCSRRFDLWWLGRLRWLLRRERRGWV